MGPVFYVLAIMGCGDGQLECEAARIAPQRFTTVQQCQAALPDTLARNSDLDYPVISGSCRPAGMQMASDQRRGPRG
jgi:hypothetical protein